MKALTLDQAGDVRDDVEPLVLRAIEVDGSITIVPVPENRELSIEELKQLARWRARQSTDRAEAERADASENRETAEAGPLTRGPDPTRESPRSGASRNVESVLPDGTDGPTREAVRGGRGGGRGAGRYRTLHYASARESGPTDGEKSGCTGETGGSS